jgi:hypothetical protein
MEKSETTKLNISIPPHLIKKIKDNNYNRNQLIVSILKKYIKNKEK